MRTRISWVFLALLTLTIGSMSACTCGSSEDGEKGKRRHRRHKDGGKDPRDPKNFEMPTNAPSGLRMLPRDQWYDGSARDGAVVQGDAGAVQ